jgi:hypothetical protein
MLLLPLRLLTLVKLRCPGLDCRPFGRSTY